ncbi:MAG: hydroxyisourate hydrolase [Actinomycetota bacterium]|nr:hydroxyisourate hydrolase [Actinomycetota bacterium]
MTASLSTHVLDAAGGGGRPGLAVSVHDESGELMGQATTDDEGRVASLAIGLAPGRYRISWRTGGAFLTAVAVTVELGGDRHYHVPLLASGASAVTYLGA